MTTRRNRDTIREMQRRMRSTSCWSRTVSSSKTSSITTSVLVRVSHPRAVVFGTPLASARSISFDGDDVLRPINDVLGNVGCCSASSVVPTILGKFRYLLSTGSKRQVVKMLVRSSSVKFMGHIAGGSPTNSSHSRHLLSRLSNGFSRESSCLRRAKNRESEQRLVANGERDPYFATTCQPEPRWAITIGSCPKSQLAIDESRYFE